MERFQMFTSLITKCSRAVKKIKTSEMAEYNLKSLHVSCLYYLYVSPQPLTATKLCDICLEDKAHISRTLDSLETNGFITLTSATPKRYNSQISLTDIGFKVAQNISSKIAKILEEASQGLKPKNREIFYSSFELISNNLEKIVENYGDKNEC